MATSLETPPAPALPRSPVADSARVARPGVSRLLVAMLALLAGAVYTAHDWPRYATFRSCGFDVGIFDQAIRHYARFQAPVSSLKGVGFSVLGDHFSPILASLAPRFWVWPDTRMLAIVLGALIGASVFPVYASVRVASLPASR